MKKVFLAASVAISLTACASSGKKIDTADLQSFVVGTTTVSDVKAKLGKPTSTSIDSKGAQTLEYDYLHGQARAESFIPIAGAFIGGSDMDTQTVTLNFDKNSKLTNYSQSTGNQNVNTGLANTN